MDVDQLCGDIGWKDSELRHLGCNASLAHTFKLPCRDAIIGLRDEELLHAEADILLHLQNDQRALRGETVKFVHCYQNEFYFATKKPTLDENKHINGIVYQCQRIEQPDAFARLVLADKKYYQKNNIPTYSIQPKTNPFALSKRELQCMFYMLRGRSAKESAVLLGLSKRTIDFYIENMKNKAGCRTKSELLVAAVELGYMKIIPD